MAKVEEALALAARGFHVFPCEVGGKLPVIKDFPNRATRDEAQIRQWWTRDYNIGISTSAFGDDQALCVVDVDNKNGKDGNARLLELELEGQELPQSLEQSTPSGGRHIIYIADRPVRQGVDVLGVGLDIRSKGGFVVGPGSEIAGKHYRQINGHGTPVNAPKWLVDRLGEARPVEPRASVVLAGVDSDRALARAREHLATVPTEDDPYAYPVACKLKDSGLTEEQAVYAMQTYWDPRCSPPRTDDTPTVVRNAYRYGREPVGVSAPEAVFDAVPPSDTDEDEHPADALNKEYAFIKRGAFVLQETTDDKGIFITEHLAVPQLHAWFANKCVQVGDRKVPLSKLWMARPSRREYDAVVFAPERQIDARWYNLWRGFRVQPAATGQHPTVDMFLDHALNNVCGGDKALCHWLIGFFAHMIQKPYEKPLVALVFRGKKGTGKNALVERVGYLLGRHFMVADDERYLLGNFNSHLESNLFFVLDEAAWAGDKRAEGKLKGLITGQNHTIERKGSEPYSVDNLSRVAIIGNERWLVPASQDERRFAVFTVGDGRKQDRKFFEAMRVGMEHSGYANLLKYLLEYDISGLDLNAAPNTRGLVEQKQASLDTVEEWWLDCLTSNVLHGSTFHGDIPATVPHAKLHEAYAHWAKQRNIRGRLAAPKTFIATLNEVAPSFNTRKPRNDQGVQEATKYNPGIDKLRADWDTFIGGTNDWE